MCALQNVHLTKISKHKPFPNTKHHKTQQTTNNIKTRNMQNQQKHT